MAGPSNSHCHHPWFRSFVSFSRVHRAEGMNRNAQCLGREDLCRTIALDNRITGIPPPADRHPRMSRAPRLSRSCDSAGCGPPTPSDSACSCQCKKWGVNEKQFWLHSVSKGRSFSQAFHYAFDNAAMPEKKVLLPLISRPAFPTYSL